MKEELFKKLLIYMDNLEGLDNLKALIAPKLYLIDYLTGSLGRG